MRAASVPNLFRRLALPMLAAEFRSLRRPFSIPMSDRFRRARFACSSCHVTAHHTYNFLWKKSEAAAHEAPLRETRALRENEVPFVL